MSDRGDRLDPESLAKRLAEQLRSTPPKRRFRLRLPGTGVLRALGVACIILGLVFGAAAAFPKIAEFVEGLGGPSATDGLDPSFAGQQTPGSSTSTSTSGPRGGR